jgi:hypothetical protein
VLDARIRRAVISVSPPLLTVVNLTEHVNKARPVAVVSVAHGDLPTETIAEPVLFHVEVIGHLQV